VTSLPAVATPPASAPVWVDPGLPATDTGHPRLPGRMGLPWYSRGGPFSRAAAIGDSLDRSRAPRSKLKRSLLQRLLCAARMPASRG